MLSTEHLLCPYCQERLRRQGRRSLCPNGHAFDLAREGYLNLLPARRPGLPPPGDSAAMLHARRRFLDGGYYQPLSDALNMEISRAVDVDTATNAIHLLDAGCGEGYYLGRLHASLRERLPKRHQIDSVGVDIAREAIRLAARRYQDIQFVVADTRSFIPCADATIDVLLNVFAPRNSPEFARIVAPAGLLVIAIPTPAHLQELRDVVPLLGIQDEKRRRIFDEFQDDFLSVDERTVEYRDDLEQAALIDLLEMMPSIRHTTAESLTHLRALNRHTVTFSFQILILRRR